MRVLITQHRATMINGAISALMFEQRASVFASRKERIGYLNAKITVRPLARLPEQQEP
jgi:hypothetical protein